MISILMDGISFIRMVKHEMDKTLKVLLASVFTVFITVYAASGIWVNVAKAAPLSGGMSDDGMRAADVHQGAGGAATPSESTANMPNTGASANTGGATSPNQPYDKKSTPHSPLIDRETYDALISDPSMIGRVKGITDAEDRFRVFGEIRYHYASGSGSPRYDRDQSGIRLYFGVAAPLGKGWSLYAMGEQHIDILNYDNGTDFSRWYVTGPLGVGTAWGGKFGYLMAEGNIYDSGFEGVRFRAGDPVTYTLAYGQTNASDSTVVATARYKAMDYDLEAGIYNYDIGYGDGRNNTIVSLGGNYHFSNISVGAMYLGASLGDAEGNKNGYVLSLGYGNFKSWMARSYGLFFKYYDQPQHTYIAHGMNGWGPYMQGFKGYGVGLYYSFYSNVVGSLEYYDLDDKITGENGKRIWTSVSYYF